MNMHPPAPTYDAFGDVADRPHVSSSRRARKVTVALFWSVALMLIAGRVYQHDIVGTPQAHTMELAAR